MIVTRSEDKVNPMVWSEQSARLVIVGTVPTEELETFERRRPFVNQGPTSPEKVEVRSVVTDTLLRPVVHVQTMIAALRDRDEGQTITEYALIIASIAVLLIIAMLFLAGKVDNLFSKTGTSVETPGAIP
jgi:Flp pilus assembly pilin Flp